MVAYAARGMAAYEVLLALEVLRGFYEVGAARLAFRDQPLPSKPVIPGGRELDPDCPRIIAPPH
jgi:hypothetical protein